jgi:membrane protease subunit HflC
MRRSIFGGLGLIVLAVIAVILYLSVFVVDQTQQALVLRFGNPVRVITTPGINYKLPLVDNVVYLDKRILDLDSSPLEIIASDQKRLVVDAFGRYKIIDPLRFYQSVGTIQVADSRLTVILNSAVRRVLGEATFIQLVKDERPELMQRIAEQVDREAKASGLGIEVADVRIRRADLPEANSQAIYQRMQTERQRQATEIRAQGEQASRRIRAEADRAATVIVATANGESSRLRGDGEARRNQIFAEAFQKDPDFFAFYRSMEAYQLGLKGSDTRLVISPDSEFFRYFNNSSGATPGEGAGAAPPPAPAAPPDTSAAPAATPSSQEASTP